MSSKLNMTPWETFFKKKLFVWAFGDNSKRALSVQNKENTIYMPEPSSHLEEDGEIVQIVSGNEHTAAVTNYGLVLTVGSNQHSKLGLAGKTILDTCTKFQFVEIINDPSLP